MTTDDNIGLLAWVMMKEYPEDAARRASLRAEAFAALGDVEMGAKWRRIAAAIRNIQPDRPSP
jgi:hypothetical protein